MRSALLIGFLLLGALKMSADGPPQSGVGLVRVFVPPAVLLDVPNVMTEAISSAPVTISFDSAALGAGQALRVSVRADGDLTIPGGAAITASNLSWTTSNVANGVGMNGMLSKTLYTPVYQSNVGATSGQVDLTWRLAPPGGGIRAGTRQAALRWRFEAITP
jgi:hypothetical protein